MNPIVVGVTIECKQESARVSVDDTRNNTWRSEDYIRYKVFPKIDVIIDRDSVHVTVSTLPSYGGWIVPLKIETTSSTSRREIPQES